MSRSSRSGAGAAGRLIRFLRKKGRALTPLLILTHDHPDPDAIASAYGLAHLARHLGGIRCRIAYGGVIGRVENQTMVRVLRLPVHRLKEHSDFRAFRGVALVDTQPGFGNNPFPEGAEAALVVDHHPPANGGRALCAIVAPEVGATSVILAQALLRAGVSIPTDLATALAYGILSETQDLGRQTREPEIRTYRRIVPLCDLRMLALIQNPQRPVEFFTALKRSLDNAFVCGDLAGAHLGPVATPDLVSQTADFLLTYEGMRWSVCTGRYRDRVYASLRAMRPGLHAGRLLQRVLQERTRAGGHWSMAGGSVPVARPASRLRWVRAERRIVARLLKTLGKERSPVLYPFRS